MATSPNLPSGTHQSVIGVPALPQVTRILSRYERPALESFISIAIDLLDTLDGDPEAEDATDMEDDFSIHPTTLRLYADRGPGCTISDAVDTMNAEDDFALTGDGLRYADAGPGDDVSDPGGCEHDGCEPDTGGICLSFGIDQDRPIGVINPLLS